MKRALVFSFLALVLAVGASDCALTPGGRTAIQTTVEVGCDVLEAWCNPDAIVSAPSRWCGLAVDACHGIASGLPVLLAALGGGGMQPALSSAAAREESFEPTACTEWGDFCAAAPAGSGELCAALESGCREGEPVTTAIVAGDGEGSAP